MVARKDPSSPPKKSHLNDLQKDIIRAFISDKIEKLGEWSEDTPSEQRSGRWMGKWNDNKVVIALADKIPNLTAAKVGGVRKTHWGRVPMPEKPPQLDLQPPAITDLGQQMEQLRREHETLKQEHIALKQNYEGKQNRAVAIAATYVTKISESEFMRDVLKRLDDLEHLTGITAAKQVAKGHQPAPTTTLPPAPQPAPTRQPPQDTDLDRPLN